MTRFFWYPDAAENPWQSWYDGQDSAVRGRHDIVIRFLESGHWVAPYFSIFRNAEGVSEIRITGRVQHRFLGCKIGDDFVVAVACVHKQNRYQPHNAIETAMRRMKEIQEGRVVAIECRKPKPSGSGVKPR